MIQNSTSPVSGASPVPTNNSSALQKTDKISEVRNRALETIRNHFPLTTLFTPELKIDLDMLVKDQIFFCKVAELLSTFNGQANVDSVKKHFEGSELLSHINSLFKNDTEIYLTLFYESCVAALNNQSGKGKVQQALESRIFTLKNALIAQHMPIAIAKSQQALQITVRDLASIKCDGANFIQEVLNIHLHFQSSTRLSFKEQLISTSEQLIPFIQKVTKSYLHEQGKTCPDNPLVFRNPTGYNQHGATAATVMEACLNALGYKTRLIGRVDLEPRVTLSTMHNLVEVTAPDQTRFIVDPCYVQFHKDICLDDVLLPTQPVLVLKEDEVDDYVEKNLMKHWKVSREGIDREDSAVIEKIINRDQYLAILIEKYTLDPEFAPPNVEIWARKSFKKIWDISKYKPIFTDHTYQDIFDGHQTTVLKTHQLVQAMKIGVLTHHLSFAEVENRLRQLIKTQIEKNSLDALSLMAQLPARKRLEFKACLDIDERINPQTGVGLLLNAYYRSLRNSVNPEGKDLSVIYGCSGADCMTPLLATDPSNLTFVDLTKTSVEEFKQALNQLKKSKSEPQNLINYLESNHKFISLRSRLGGSSSVYRGNGNHMMENLPLKILFDLQELGVDLNDVKIVSIENNQGVRVIFSWKYFGKKSARKRSLWFVTADITKPNEYPEVLKNKLKEGFDIFYMKAAFFAPSHYPKFLPQLASSMKQGGWLMTSDTTHDMHTVNPEECLNQNSLSFKYRHHAETKVLEELLNPPFEATTSISNLDNYGPQERYKRMAGSDTSYWSILNLRQKM